MSSGISEKIWIITTIFLILSVSISPASSYPDGNDVTNVLAPEIQHDISDFDDNITSFMEGARMPALSTCIIKNNSIVWSKGYGEINIRRETETTADHIYMAGSISKTITATAILQLYEQGLLDLDDDVNTYLPFSLRNPNHPDVNITIRMLLSHHSSLSNKKLSLFFYFTILRFPLERLEDYLVPHGSIYTKRIWLDSVPGEQAYYSDEGFEILGYIVELITNQSFGSYCTEHIFQPLGMENTSFYLDDLDEQQLATPYIWIPPFYIPLSNYENRNYASGGLQTTVLDLAHFLLAQTNGGVYDGERILEEETVKLMHTVQYPDTNIHRGRRFGLGWCLWVDANGNLSRQGHTGAVPGFVSLMVYNSSRDTGVLFLTNRYNGITLPHLFYYWGKIEQELFHLAETLIAKI